MHRCYTERLHNRPSCIVRRGSTYHFRKRVPDALQPLLGRSEAWRSLRTDSLITAVKRSHAVAAEIEANFERARSVIEHGEQIAAFEPTTMHEARCSQERPLVHSISEVYRLYLADPRHSRCHRTMESYGTTGRWIGEFFGAETPASSITRERCREFLAFLMAMPRHANKKFPGKTISEAVAETAGRTDVERINAANVNAYLNKFNGALNWAEREGLIPRNPAKGLRICDPVKRKDKRRPFSPDQLRLIFSAPLYLGCKNDEHGYASPGIARPRRARFWIPLLALHTGLRMNELCQLDTGDVVMLGETPCFLVREGVDAEGGTKRLKSAASERVVPVHDALVKLGFLGYVAERRARADVKLWPKLQPGSNGYRSKTFSQWFSRFVIASGAAAPLTCFHSFRHCFRDALRASGVSRDMALALGGWTSNAAGSEIAEYLRKRFPTENARRRRQSRSVS